MRHLMTITIVTVAILLLAAGFFRITNDAPHTPAPGPVTAAQAAEDDHDHDGAEHQQYTCSMHPFIIQDEPGDCPICGMKLTPVKKEKKSAAAGAPSGERRIKYWVAPMDPTYIRDQPGKSPMGMDLVPVYEDEAASGQVITIDPVTVQNMGVRTTRVSRRDLAHTIKTVGVVTYQEPLQYTVNTKVGGWVETLYVNETGQKVEAGAPLLAIYSPDLVAAQQEFLLAKANADRLKKSPFAEIRAGAERLLAASRQRLALWDISERQIRKLEDTGAIQKNLVIHAPYDGIVTMKMVNQGAYVNAGQNLFTISDISRVWVNADIYEYELPWLDVGQEAVVELPYSQGHVLRGTVSYIYPFVEPKTRTVKARLAFANPEFNLKPDMYVNVRIKARPRHDVLAVPADAVLRSGDLATVFVALGNGKFEPRQVKTGLEGDGAMVEIVQGLLDGETVVTSAQFMLDSESTLRAAIQKMLEAKRPAGNAGESAPPAAGKTETPAPVKPEDLF